MQHQVVDSAVREQTLQSIHSCSHDRGGGGEFARGLFSALAVDSCVPIFKQHIVFKKLSI